MESYNIIRITIVIISGISIFLGYRLFYLVTERQGKLLFQKQDVKFSLGDVGPGIFFALFGAICIISVLFTQPFKDSNTTTTQDENGIITTNNHTRIPASSDHKTSIIDFSSMCIDNSAKELYSVLLLNKETLEWFYVNERYKLLSDEEKNTFLDDILKSTELKNNFDVTANIDTVEDMYIFYNYVLSDLYLLNKCRN